MPRSKDPRNYGPDYWKLVELMDRGVRRFELSMSPAQATSMRNTYYAFTNAWKHEAIRLSKDKLLTEATRAHKLEIAIRYEDLLREHMVMIEQITPHDAKLTILSRALEDRAQGVLSQLSAYEAQAGESYDEIKQRLERGPQAEPGQATAQGKSIVDEWQKMAGGAVHLEDIDVPQDLIDNPELADQERNAAPPDPQDLTDLITPSNPPSSPEVQAHINPMEEAFKLAEKAREREKKASKASENSS